MKKLIFSIAITLIAAQYVHAQLYSTQSGTISFYSKTPVEDIDAHSVNVLAVINIEKRELAFNVANTSFNFKNKLMQEHFNEKYMESEQYPNSTFKGKINEPVDLLTDGEYKVTVSGKLNVHGVEQERTIPGTVIVNNGTINLKADFKVVVKDHNIQIPTIVSAKIAEEINVIVNTVLVEKKK